MERDRPESHSGVSPFAQTGDFKRIKNVGGCLNEQNLALLGFVRRAFAHSARTKKLRRAPIRTFMRGKYNSLKYRALAVFENRGWLSPPAWAVLASFYPVRASYTYLRRLHRWKLLDRAMDRRGLLLYRLSR